jgi:hypothetical protein
MRQVRLKRNAFINASYCTAGSVVSIGDDVALAPFMALIASPAPTVAPPPQSHTVTLRYSESAGEVDITVDGVETKLDHAALKLRMD